MKTPKVESPKSKLKFNTPKSGLVRKSLGQTPAKSLKKFSGKGEQLLSFVKENENNVELKSRIKKNLRISLPANALSNNKSSPCQENGETSKVNTRSAGKKFGTPEVHKSGKKKSISNIGFEITTSSPRLQKTSQDDISGTVKTPVLAENNSSPIKKNVDVKKKKLPFSLESSEKQIPNKIQPKVETSPGKGKINSPSKGKINIPNKGKINSPEVELGLQLEEALSPKSKKKVLIKNKLASQGKVEVFKKNILETSSVGQHNGAAELPNKTTGIRRMRRRRWNQKEKLLKKPSILKHVNALNAVNALLKTTKLEKVDLLNTDKYLYMQFNLLKQHERSQGVYKVLLPHHIIPDSPEVCLIIPDLKGKRNDPEEAIDYYKEVLKTNNITAITEIIPVRKLKQEYSQYEEITKFANRFDFIISDGRVASAARLGKKFAKSKKCICSINFNSKALKDDVEKALRKASIFSSGKGTCFSVKCGRIGMPAKDIADNIIAIGEFLSNNESLVGDAQNISSVYVKSAKSNAFPIYVSTVTPNEVPKPKGKEQKAGEPVEDEVTTVPDATVVVYPSGNVKVKKRKNEENVDKGILFQKKLKNDALTLNDQETSGEDEFFKDESDSDNLSDEEDSDADYETNDEDSKDLSDVIEDQSVDDENGSVNEEEIEAAEKEYLKELRLFQDEVVKQGTKGAVKNIVDDKKKKQNNTGVLKKKKGNENKNKSQDEKEQGSVSQMKKQDIQNNAKGNKKQSQKMQKKGGSPSHQKNVNNTFQKRSPGKEKNQNLKKGLGVKNRK